MHFHLEKKLDSTLRSDLGYPIAMESCKLKMKVSRSDEQSCQPGMNGELESKTKPGDRIETDV